MQINYRDWHASPLLKGLDNVFGSTVETDEGETVVLNPHASAGRFNGNDLSNITAGGRILRSYGGAFGADLETRAKAAGFYRSGKGRFLKRKLGQQRYNERANAFKKIAPAWDTFFKCLGVYP